MIRKHTGFRLAWLILLFLCAPFSVLSGPLKIQQADEPLEGRFDLVLETIWEQPTEDADYLVGRMTHAVLDTAGHLCIVEYQQKCLFLFDLEGNWLRTLGREGDGPGELRDARQVFLQDGRFGLLQAFPGSMVWLNADGTPHGKILFGRAIGAEGAFVLGAGEQI